MIPAGALLLLLGAWTALGVAATFSERLQPAFLAAGAALCAVALLDALLALHGAPVRLKRQASRSLALGTKSTVRLRADNPGAGTALLVLHDHVPTTLATAGLPLRLRVPKRSAALAAYEVTAARRGLATFGRIAWRRLSPLRLWWRQSEAGEPQTVRVYPNFKEVARYALAARGERLDSIGIHKRRRRGEGTDFHQLREYRFGDSLRQIDWRATSRLRKAISREYHDERDQQVVFVLDTGRGMRSRDGELSHLDHALNAVLLLSYVALRQGDAVGLLTLGGEQRWLQPRKGPSYIKTILNGVYDLEASPLAFDPRAAVEGVARHVAKRSLVIVVTNIRDDATRDFRAVLSLAGRRHAVLLASLRERVLGDILGRQPKDLDAALTIAATHHYLAERELAHRRLARSGIHTLDVEPHRLPARLVNRYLAMKAGGVV